MQSITNPHPAIISVSRRTDIPAFYGDWFLQRIKEGFAGYINPFGGRRYLVQLQQTDVVCFVFWSKNYTPFLKHLDAIASLGYKFYFNFTLTGLPSLFEPGVFPVKDSVQVLKQLAGKYSPRVINWRYDPVIISSGTDFRFHLENFRSLATQLEGYVHRCFFSYVWWYAKVKKNFDRLRSVYNWEFPDPGMQEKKEFARKLADIAETAGIRLYTCCGDYLLDEKIFKAHCIDGTLIRQLFNPGRGGFITRPTRKECGCTQSIDIGAYNTCAHGCLYCYANSVPQTTCLAHYNQDAGSAFLGYSSAQSAAWLKELEGTPGLVQGELFE